ncbi:MAG: ATP-binding cassette domain-containing protein [Burkholderiaceae bacterium]|nr:ATP-binding cassette domain-containing protein [Burkholderiaceae bacterium]
MTRAPVPALRVRALHHAFARETVLEDIDFELRAGEVVALVGPSGCGKTTLLHLGAKLLHPDGGTIDDDFAMRACMFQQPTLLPWKSALDNVAIVLAARGVARGECGRRARAIGLRLGLAHADFAKFPHQLSGGMQSRIALARALVVEPDLLLLDEPFSALDIGLREEMYRLLLDHLAARRVGVLMITHDLGEAVRLSDRILVMAARPGRIVSRIELDTPATRRDDTWIHASTARLLARPEVRASFGLPAILPAAGDPQDDESRAASRPAIAEAVRSTAVSTAPSTASSVIPFERRAQRC